MQLVGLLQITPLGLLGGLYVNILEIIMIAYPKLLTSSDWIDWLEQPNITRDDKIAALATWHRRIDYDARQSVLSNVSYEDANTNAILVAAAKVLATEIPTPVDYLSAQAEDAIKAIDAGTVGVVMNLQVSGV